MASDKTLEQLFSPESIAIIGATDRIEKVGYALFRNIVYGGYRGRIYPVNQRLKTLEGYRVYSDFKEIPDRVDLAIISIPLKYIPDLMDDLGAKGVKSAIVISAGGKEIGEKGRLREAEILKKAKQYGIRFLGPNCFGFINTSMQLNANFGSTMPIRGRTAFVSQSGALFSSIMDWAIDREVGFSYCISIGNMADLQFGELIDFLGSREDVDTILIYMESLLNARDFARSALRVAGTKPVIIAKSGRSEMGSIAASSHTGAMAGKDYLYTALFKRCGLVRVDTVESLFNLTEAVSKQPIPAGPRFVVLTNAGGPGVMAVDRFDAWGIEPAPLSEETIRKLDAILPSVWSRHNPVDIIGDAPPERFRESLSILMEADEVDGILGILTPQFMTEPYEIAFQVEKIAKGRKPFYFTLLGGERLKKANQFLKQNGIPPFETPEQSVDTMVLAHRYRERLHLLQSSSEKERIEGIHREGVAEIIRKALVDGREMLTEGESKEIFALYGIDTNATRTAASVEEAVRIAGDMGYPLALKIDSPDISHKSDAHAVLLNIGEERELTEGFHRVIQNSLAYRPNARIRGVSLQKMVESGFECIIGSGRDEIFRQYILFGEGGTMVEYTKDVAFGFPPLSRVYAREMIRETKISRLLQKGHRERPPVPLEKVEEALLHISRLVEDHPEILELDVNPLMATGRRVVAVDGRIRLSSEGNTSHMILG